MKRVSAPVSEYRTYRVLRKDREPLLNFMLEALREKGCQILHSSPSTEAPFRITFETPEGERMGVVAYAFLANSKETKNRPPDEHRFQLKYGSKDGLLHELWQDPFGLYTTILLGINTEHGFFVGYDPSLHSPTLFFISLEFKQHHVDQILQNDWHVWERERKKRADKEPIEVLVGGTATSFLSYIRFEREAAGEDQGHRHLLGERAPRQPATIHTLSREFELTEKEVLDVIENAHRLKVAVRGWVAEEHLRRQLSRIPGIRCTRLPGDGPDLSVRLRGGRELTIECKNVLRKKDREGLARLDFQRTRAAKSDFCSRYYSTHDFDVVAACLHAVTERWEFQFAPTGRLDPHLKCPGKLSSSVRLDGRWSSDPLSVLRVAAADR